MKIEEGKYWGNFISYVKAYYELTPENQQK